MLAYSTRRVTCFEKLNLLGEGTYGSVYRALDKATGEVVALKKLRPVKEKSGFPLTSVREITLLKQVSHPNIIRLREVAVGRKQENIFLVFDFCKYDLATLIDRMTRPFSEAEVKRIMVQLLAACEYLHANSCIHRDLKLSNLLWSDPASTISSSNSASAAAASSASSASSMVPQLKLADFGLARLFSNPLQAMTPKVVTLWYRAPELLLGTERYSSAIDCWSIGQTERGRRERDRRVRVKRTQESRSLICVLSLFFFLLSVSSCALPFPLSGCIFGELLRHRPLLPGRNESHQLALICALLGTPNEKIWPGFGELVRNAADGVSLPTQPYNNLSHEFPNLGEAGLDLLSRLLTYDPSKRITSEKALAHPYFSQAPLPCPEHLMPTFAPPATPARNGNNANTTATTTTIQPTAAVPPMLPPVQMMTTSLATTRKRKPEEDVAEMETAAPNTDTVALKRTKRDE